MHHFQYVWLNLMLNVSFIPFCCCLRNEPGEPGEQHHPHDADCDVRRFPGWGASAVASSHPEQKVLTSLLSINMSALLSCAEGTDCVA